MNRIIKGCNELTYRKRKRGAACWRPSAFFLPVVVLLAALFCGDSALAALSSPNIPLDSPLYLYIEKLSGYGLVSSDFRGIRPYTRSEAARLVREAEERLLGGDYPLLAQDLVARIKELIPREVELHDAPGQAPLFDYNLVSNAQLRYVYLDGAPRNYKRLIIDPAGDWTFPTLHWRPRNTDPVPKWQRGTEGTPLFENNEGVVYGGGSNLEGRFSAEAFGGHLLTGVIEPLFLWSEHGDTGVDINKWYVKLGGGELELEWGRDANWLGVGYRGAITLTNNAQNFTGLKLSSPEPFTSKYLWDLKYLLIASRFDRTEVGGRVRQPYFYATKLSMKPLKHLEFGLNLGRQVGGPGLDNGLGTTLRGLVGATNDDNSNTIAGVELRFRLPWLRYTEIYGELSGEDRNGFWPKAQSYVVGFFVPALTKSGRDDLRFEWFWGHQILYTNATFPNGYLYHNFPIGHSQGGATQDFFLRYSHWFTPRNILGLECIYTTRGEMGRVSVDSSGQYDPDGHLQAVERKLALRASWSMPLYKDFDARLVYGWENIENWNLQWGVDHVNNLVHLDVTYRY